MIQRRSDLLLAGAILGVLLVATLGSVQGQSVTIGGNALGSSCWVNSWLGILCPFCGMSRSFIALGHGDMMLSLSHHPGGFLMFSMALVVLGSIVAAGLRRSPPISSRRLFLPAVQTVSLTCVGLGVVRTLVS